MKTNLERLHSKYIDKLYNFLKKRGFLVDEEQIEKQHKKNQKLVKEFINWLVKEKRITSKATIAMHKDNISAFLEDLLSYGMCSVFNMNDENLLSFILDRSIRKRIVPQHIKKKLLTSLQLFFEFLEQEYNVDLSWAKTWCIKVKKFYLRQVKAFEKTGSTGLLWDTRHYGWQEKSIAYLEKNFLYPPPTLDDDLEWGEYMGPLESLLLSYFNRLLVDFIRKIDPNFTMPFEEKYQKVLEFQRKWAKTPIPEFDNKTPIELIKMERKLYGKLQSPI